MEEIQGRAPVRVIQTLVIEDNLTNLELMTYILSAFGHTTLSAMDGEEGIRLATACLPSVIICDIQLPKLDGYEVARRLKEHPELRHIPLIAVTALAMVGDRERILAAGFDGYIPKPIAPDLFVKQVESYLPVSERIGHVRPETPETVSEPLTALGAKRGTILLINHSPSNAEVSRKLLEPSGFTVLSEEDRVTAISIASLTRPDLVLYDVHSHTDRGCWFLEKFHADKRLSATPIILLASSTWSNRDRVAMGEYPHVRFLVRPLDPIVLFNEVDACLAKAASRDAVN